MRTKNSHHGQLNPRVEKEYSELKIFKDVKPLRIEEERRRRVWNGKGKD